MFPKFLTPAFSLLSLMDTAREGKPHDAVSGEGLGAGGKFRKRPFRRVAKTTPYNRPPTALRVRSRSTAFTAITGSSSLSVSTGAAPNFKFGCTVSSTSASPVAATSGIESEAVKTRPYTGFGNLSSNPFVGTSAANASTGRSNFGFGATITSTANDQSQGSLFGAGSGSVLNSQASFSNSMPMHFSSTSSSQSFGLARNTAFSSGSSLFAASTSAAKLFNSGAAFKLSSSASSSEANTSSAIGGATSSLFGSGWQSTKSNPIFVSAFNSTSSSAGLSSASTASVPATTSPSTGFPFTASTAAANATSPPSVFAFGASAPSVAATSSSPGIFGSSIGASSGPAYLFTSGMAAPSSQPVFGNLSPGFAFNSAASGNNDQMNMEDSMAEDTVQASMPAVPAFNPHPVAPPQSSFVFGSTPTSTTNTFNFVALQQILGTVQNPFQAKNSLGGSFSVGAGGGDKSGRKIVKVSRKLRKK
jgi:hypothetical protein